MVKFTKTIEMGFGVFIMIPMWGSIHPGRSRGGTQKKEKRERQDETQFITKIAVKTSLGPSYFVL
jgi:hypothetical protein